MTDDGQFPRDKQSRPRTRLLRLYRRARYIRLGEIARMTALLPNQCLLHGGTDFCGTFDNMNTAFPHLGHLLSGSSLTLGDDRSCVAHSPPWRTRLTGDETDNRLLEMLAYILSGFLFG